MPNKNGSAYGLTALCPLRNDTQDNQSAVAIVRGHLRALAVDESSPFARVPNTYLCRMFVLDDVFYEGSPAQEEHLQSKYLVLVVDLHGDLDAYLTGLWTHAQDTVRKLWNLCIAFDQVTDAASFVRYIKKCQVETTFYFNGSNDAPLAEQLKALYLKQELSKFVFAHQGMDAASLQQAFQQFVARVEPKNLASPTWRAGASSLEVAVTGAST